MSADNALPGDETAETMLEDLLKSWHPAAPAATPITAHRSPDHEPEARYSPRLPAFRPALRQDGGLRGRLPAMRPAGPGRDASDEAIEPSWPAAEHTLSFEDVAQEVSARAALSQPPDDGDCPAEGRTGPDEIAGDERRFAARIVALDAAGTLDHSVTDGTQPPLGRIGGYRFFSDEQNPEAEEAAVPDEDETILALAAVFNADPMAFEAADERRTPRADPARRASAVASLLQDDVSEDLAIKSIFL